MIIPKGETATMQTAFDYYQQQQQQHQQNSYNSSPTHHQTNASPMLSYAYPAIKPTVEIGYYSPASSVELCNTSNNSQHSSNSVGSASNAAATNSHSANDLLSMQSSTDKLWNSLDEMSNESYSYHSSASNNQNANQFGSYQQHQQIAAAAVAQQTQQQYNQLYQKNQQIVNHHVNRMMLHMPPTPPNSEVPPISTAAIAGSVRLSPMSASAELSRDRKMIEASPAMVPDTA